ncbi:site-specific DNA-methyltransferase [Anabaena sp. FACHB-1237]|uniref:DNA-methyltransferase n=1 Tax=Anabaena sp. FACHB-1237 TaxID=2692769 RepID=UPI001680F2C5|nr:site-specific DNA-methyltransferase [Anabaena sp. FACHB-1237]MBD2139162.1 site-specific DNA-methyltransferase [Anabaena sp. FACHB-1237]
MKVIHGNSLEILPKIDSGSMQMIYLDPPFFTQKTHSLMSKDNQVEYSFQDHWDSRDHYLKFMHKILIQCHRILKQDGTIFLHCDQTASHHLRILLDEIFGIDNFQSEIIWTYKRWSNSKKGLLNSHQNIYFYSKTKDFKFNRIYTDYSPTTNVEQILQSRQKNHLGKSIYQRDKQGEIIINKEKKGVPLSDVWNIPFLNPKAKERVGYPTQKPILLLEQIINISTDEGDPILDAFCGSGTTLVAAKILGREAMGIDISLDAVQLTEKRLIEPIKTTSNLLNNGEGSYLQKSEYERNILKAMDAIPVERNNGIDGLLKYHIQGYPVTIKIQKSDEDLETAKERLILASKSKKCQVMILVRTHENYHRLLPCVIEDHQIIVIDAYDFIINKYSHNLEVHKL